MLKKVVITGISGFIGSNISEYLLSHDFQVYGIVRKKTNIKRLEGFDSSITFFDIDDTDLKLKLAQLGEYSLIHCAWNGVNAELRNDWLIQAENISYFARILNLVESTQIKKLIFLGSQAEYGKIDFEVHEGSPLELNNVYGISKNSCRHMLELFASEKNINWIWLRVFSLFGPREDDKWLIPSLIQKMKKSKNVELTKGEQIYSYLYVSDFSRILHLILEKKVNNGIYNIANKNTVVLKDLIGLLKEKINSNAKLMFGAIPYRTNQSMVISASIDKIIGQIGDFTFTDISKALEETIAYYEKNQP
jgi:nucleoside-diphosphate-sugar epimerase